MNAQRSIAFIAFLITGWIIASIALSGDIIQSTTPLSVGPLFSALLSAGSDIVLSVAIAIMALFFYWLIRDRSLITDALSDMFSRRKGKTTNKSNRNLKRDILSAIIFISILSLIRSKWLPQSRSPKGGGSSSGSSFFIIPGFDGEAFQSSLLGTYHFFAVWAFQIIFIAMTGTCIVIFLRAFTQIKARRDGRLEDNETIKADTITALQEGHKELKGDHDYRTAILNCYQQLCRIFEPKGSISYRVLTARELRERMVEKFSSAEQPISLLTSLFEEARYSSHHISADMKETALTSIKQVEEHLRHSSERTLETIQ